MHRFRILAAGHLQPILNREIIDVGCFACDFAQSDRLTRIAHQGGRDDRAGNMYGRKYLCCNSLSDYRMVHYFGLDFLECGVRYYIQKCGELVESSLNQ